MVTPSTDSLRPRLPEAGLVRRAQLTSFGRQTPLNAVTTAATSCLAATAMWDGAPRWGVVTWLGLQFLFVIFAMTQWLRRQPADPTRPASQRGMRRAAIMAGASGLTWGGVVLLLPGLDEAHRLVVLMTMGAMLAGGAMTLGAIPAAAMAYILGIAVPAIAFFLVEGGTPYLILAALTAIYVAAMQGSTRIVHTALIRNLRAEQANADLLSQFRAERSEWLDIDEAGEAVALFDAELRLLLWNRNFLEVLSLHPGVVDRGAAYADLLRAAARPIDVATGARDLRDWIGEQTSLHERSGAETEFVLDNGRRLRGRARRTASGRVAVSFADITALTAAEAARRGSERRAQVIVDNAIDIVTLFDADGTIRFESPSVTDALGYAPEELVGNPVMAFIHPEDRDRAAAAIADAVHNPNTQARPIELRVRHKDGGWRHLEVRGRSLLDEPAVNALLINARDVTERKAAQEALRRGEQQLRLVIDNLPFLIAYCGPDRRLLYVNPAAARWFGRPAEEVVGHSSDELMPQSEYAQIGDEIGRALAGEAVHGERKAQFPGRPTRWIEYDYIPDRGDDGTVRGFIALAAEVTERRAMEERLRQAQKMEAIGQLTGGIAHDFNNLLAVIVGNIDLLRLDLPDPALEDRLDRVIAAAERGASLTQRLLAFARRQTLQPVLTDVGALIAEMTALLRRSLGEAIRIEVAREDRLWPCLIDPSQLESAILNLAVNARDAMPQGGRLSIAARNVTLDAAAAAAQPEASPGDYILVAVTDTGAGMTPAVAARAFEPFFTTKEIGQGTGLGLSMVYGFVRQSGGHVTLSSEPGRGTSVALYLPRAAAAKVAAQPVAGGDATYTGGGARILVVEDNPEMLAFSMAALRQLGHAPIAARSIEEAFAALESDPTIAMLFADVVLGPGMSGADLATAVRGRWPAIKILLTSGFAEGAGLGAERNTPFLPKPFRIADLRREVGKLLEQGV